MTISKGALVALVLWLSIAAIFAFDVVMAADDVSVAFLYTVPIFLSILSSHRGTYYFVSVTTLLSFIGALLLPADDGLSLHTNRVIAILAQWLVAALVLSRRHAEQILHRALEAERHKVERQKRFLSILSHEIGTSLTTIDGQIFRLARKTRMPSAEEIAQRSAKIKASVRHIQALMQHVQLADEVEDKVLELNYTELALKPLVLDVVQQIKQAHPQALIHAETDGLPVTVCADPFMMRQIIENVVSNAAKYSPAGAPVMIDGDTAEAAMTLRVADKGRGIPKGELSRVFDIYFRGSNSRGVHGTGVGLYIAERFAAAHGGSVAIESQLGFGTVVTLRMPILKPEPNA